MSNVRLKYSRGFTVVELLVALVITGMVLVAIAGAINASSVNYTANEDMFKAMNTARLVLLRITSEVRTAQAVAVSEPVTQCSIITADGSDITYSYNSTEQKLYLITNDDTGDDDYVMCENITDITFTRRALASDPGVVKDVMISITTTAGKITQTISSAAVVRNNLM